MTPCIPAGVNLKMKAACSSETLVTGVTTLKITIREINKVRFELHLKYESTYGPKLTPDHQHKVYSKSVK
jgi:hypothetical protein